MSHRQKLLARMRTGMVALIGLAGVLTVAACDDSASNGLASPDASTQLDGGPGAAPDAAPDAAADADAALRADSSGDAGLDAADGG